jgi:hypothetical protein
MPVASASGGAVDGALSKAGAAHAAAAQQVAIELRYYFEKN